MATAKSFTGLAAHAQHVAHLGLPGWLGYLPSTIEFFGGILLIVGLLTRFVSLAVMIDMTVAVWKVHWRNGRFGKGGYEFPFTLLIIVFVLVLFGGGLIAIDAPPSPLQITAHTLNGAFGRRFTFRSTVATMQNYYIKNASPDAVAVMRQLSNALLCFNLCST